ncbi:hypothetical protein E5673_14370 [Sphingomonas sp. PAMC26645]|uniref:hypothetical protein n=1 Tax=Sphingomonas sp. PAMC26645 TaxID=2565555 RepID=UPI00109DB2B1|nr:hypothetical protein [Sphingomonas sp. PAMC26645]QCB43263.1 hypothetical protein E5673_14370 [Sphingomonas sp. PAMC26645]
MMDEDGSFDEHEFHYLYGEQASRRLAKTGVKRAGRTTGLRLYTATIAMTDRNVMIQAFHASLARSVDEVRARLAGRFGPHIADGADIRIGMYPAAPLVVALVPPPVVEMICRVARHGADPKTRKFEVDIQQCIRA